LLLNSKNSKLAKVWRFYASRNISRAALTSGLEWNLKVTTAEIPHIIEKFKRTFET